MWEAQCADSMSCPNILAGRGLAIHKEKKSGNALKATEYCLCECWVFEKVSLHPALPKGTSQSAKGSFNHTLSIQFLGIIVKPVQYWTVPLYLHTSRKWVSKLTT